MPPKSPPKGNSKARERRKLAKMQEQKVKESKLQVETGVGFIEKGNYSKGIASFTSAIEINPENIEAYINRGRAYKEMKEFDKAITDFSKAIELDKTNAEGYSNRGGAYEMIEDFDKAIEDYTSVIELCPDDDHAYNMRGNARQAKRITGLKLKNAEFASVISDFTKALELNPYNYYAYTNRGTAYFDRKDYRSAIDDYTQSINIKVDYVYAYIRRGLACFEAVLHEERIQAQKQQEAQQLREEGKSKANKVVDEQKLAWELEFRQQEEAAKKEKEKKELLSNALRDFSAVLTFDDTDLQGYTYRAKVYDLMGLTDKAKADRDKVIEMEAKLAKEKR